MYVLRLFQFFVIILMSFIIRKYLMNSIPHSTQVSFIRILFKINYFIKMINQFNLLVFYFIHEQYRDRHLVYCLINQVFIFLYAYYFFNYLKFYE